MGKLVIKGAIYATEGHLLMPHYTGDFCIVDCTEFKKEDSIRSEYSEDTAAGFLENSPITYNGVNYYECEYSPWDCEDLTLLSDLSMLEHINHETEF